MISKNIINSISPLKARKGKGVAGKVGMKATATRAQDRSGFSRSGVVPSGKGYMSNLESLTAGTRVTGSLVDALRGKGPGGQPRKNNGDFGKIEDFEDIETGTRSRDIPGTTITDPLPGYETRWNQMSDPGDKDHNKYLKYVEDYGDDAFTEWDKDAKEWNRKNPGGARTRQTKGYTEYRDYKIVNGKEVWTSDWYRK